MFKQNHSDNISILNFGDFHHSETILGCQQPIVLLYGTRSKLIITAKYLKSFYWYNVISHKFEIFMIHLSQYFEQ